MELNVERGLAESAVAQAAARLRAAADCGRPCQPVRDLFLAGDMNAAYAVQELNTECAIAAGRILVGRKIGLTSAAVQRQLGVDQPDFGILFSDMAVTPGAPIPVNAVLQPKIEAEIALIMGADLLVGQPTRDDLAACIAYLAPALEVVGSRIANWDIGIVDTIADNASAGLFALGDMTPFSEDLNLAAAQMVLRQGGEIVSAGSGAQCLGHPLNAALWLAREMAQRGRPLLAGDVVLTGALGPMVSVEPGDSFEATIDGLGVVSVLFARS